MAIKFTTSLHRKAYDKKVQLEKFHSSILSVKLNSIEETSMKSVRMCVIHFVRKTTVSGANDNRTTDTETKFFKQIFSGIAFNT